MRSNREKARMPQTKKPRKKPKGLKAGMAIGAIAGALGFGYHSIETIHNADKHRTEVSDLNEKIRNCIDDGLPEKVDCSNKLLPDFDLDRFVTISGATITKKGDITDYSLTVNVSEINNDLTAEFLDESTDNSRFTEATSVFGSVALGIGIGALAGGLILEIPTTIKGVIEDRRRSAELQTPRDIRQQTR